MYMIVYQTYTSVNFRLYITKYIYTNECKNLYLDKYNIINIYSAHYLII